MDQSVLIAFGACAIAALATVLGAAVLFNAKEPHPRLLSFGLAFAAGAMVYISLVEIFVKSQSSFLEVMPDKGAYSYATFAFFAGVLLIAALDRLIPNPHNPLHGDHVHDHKAVARVGMM